MIPAIISGVSNLLSGFINQGFNERNMELQSRYAQNLADYQWRNFQSPKAQVEALHDAGLNPGVIFGEKGGSSLPSPSMNMPSSAPVSVPPVFSLSDISNYMLSVANAKKAGMDTRLSEQEIQNKEVERQAKEFELDLQKQFGREKWISGLSNAYMDLLLKADETSINEYKKRSEAAIADAKESERDILRQRLENNPTLIRLENDLLSQQSKTEQSKQTSNYASANASNAQADLSRAQQKFVTSQTVEQDFFNEVRQSDGVKDSFIKQFREFGNQAIRNGWLTYFEMESARHAVSQAAYADNMKEYTYWINQVNNVISTAAGAGAAFGALKHFNMLDKALGQPKTTTTENYNAFGEMSGRSVSTTK